MTFHEIALASVIMVANAHISKNGTALVFVSRAGMNTPMLPFSIRNPNLARQYARLTGTWPSAMTLIAIANPLVIRRRADNSRPREPIC
jgi:hypothetical protein